MANEVRGLATLKSIEGRKIIFVEPRVDWRGRDIDRFVLHLDDGSRLEIGSLSHSGCPECDPDGCNDATITVDLTKG